MVVDRYGGSTRLPVYGQRRPLFYSDSRFFTVLLAVSIGYCIFSVFLINPCSHAYLKLKNMSLDLLKLS